MSTDGFSVQMRIAMTEAEVAVKHTDGDLVATLRAAMKATCGHWLCTNEDERFRAAVGAVMLYYGNGSPEWKRLEHEMTALRTVSAIITAAQAGLTISADHVAERLENEPQEHVGLLKMWRDICAEEGK